MLQMKKLLNVLYVSTQSIYLHQEGDTVVAEKDHKTILRLPIHTLAGIVCFGNVLCSPFLLGLCGEHGVHVSFLSDYGKFLARVEGSVSGNVLLRIAQTNASNTPQKSKDVASSFVIGKLLNSRAVIMRRLRDHGMDNDCQKVAEHFSDAIRRVKLADNINAVRGIEGEAASFYFSVFNKLLVAQESDFSLKSRSRRPPLDPMNALLSFLYTLLAHDCEGALQSVGLDPQIGFLHALRAGRPSLALDLMEEFRAILADRLAISLVNLNQLSIKDFTFTDSGAVLLAEDARKTVLTAWQRKKQDELVHPFINEKIKIGLLPYVQALLLARFLRGDMDAYPPFILR